jgi:hypothetical protein
VRLAVLLHRHDQYFKRDDVGIIYQMNVVPGRRRSLVGATLVKAMFERAAYGCRLFCCWCAQDIEANHFWESLGFVPLAFGRDRARRGACTSSGSGGFARGTRRRRIGSRARRRAGAIREDRLVLPIPPGHALERCEADRAAVSPETKSRRRHAPVPAGSR